MQTQFDAESGIEISEATKAFGDLRAVDNVSLTAAPGQVLGLLGHNGAGKTTLMRLIAGLLRPDAGSVSVLGRNPAIDGRFVRSNLGALPSTQLIDGRLTGAENLMFAATVRGIDRTTAADRTTELLTQFSLETRRDDRAAEFSAGMKQRLALACVLVAHPRILLLDEPTSAMDPLAAKEFLDQLRHLRTVEDRIIILATHDLGVASELCDDVLILSQGQVILQGAPQDLTEKLGTKTRVRVGPNGQVNRAAEVIRQFNSKVTVLDDRSLEVDRLARSSAPLIVRRMVEQGLDVFSFSEETATLEDLYFELHQQSLDDGPTANPPATDRTIEGVCS